jgi:hypothetical protein
LRVTIRHRRNIASPWNQRQPHLPMTTPTCLSLPNGEPRKLSEIKEADMAKGQMKSNKEAKKPKKAVAEKSAGKGIVDVFAKAKGGKK